MQIKKTEIKNQEEYRGLFFSQDRGMLPTSGKDNLIKALEEIQQNRRFEIDNYWKRATYFWAFIIAIYTAYYNLKIENKFDSEFARCVFIFVTSIMGYFFCLAWHLSNKASKYWQKNWECHQALLEPRVYGKLYSTYLNENSFSVSRINTNLSFICVVISAFLTGYEILNFSKSFKEHINENCNVVVLSIILIASLIIGGTILFCCLSIVRRKSVRKKIKLSKKTINFINEEYID